MSGVVYLVGAGPGDPGLITRRGADLVARADVVVYDGLASPVLLRLARAGSELIYAGKKHTADGAHPMVQDDIQRLLVDRARAGKQVVRLKGGDPFVFGRGAEECEALAEAGVRFEVVPGVSAATAVAAYAGIPLTARGVASSVAYATGHEAEDGGGDAEGRAGAIDWTALARVDTVVLFMAVATAAECCDRLLAAGRDPATPAAAIHWGTTAAQRTVVAALADLPSAIRTTGLRPPALLVIGDVVHLRQRLSWFEDRPLAGARVLVTRAPEQAERFGQAMAELGAEPLHCPLTRIVPPPPDQAARLVAAFDRLDRTAWIVFASANAVDRFFAALTERRLDARALAATRLACVGAATAAALAARGLLADLVPAHGDAAGVARAVIEASGGAMAGARVLVPRAAEGRDEAVDLLRAAGADVDAAAVYQLAKIDASDPSVAVALARLRAREIRAAAFFAPSQVRALCDLLGPEAPAILAAVPILAAIGPTTAAALAARGLTVHVVPATPDADVLAAAIAVAAGEAAAAARRNPPPHTPQPIPLDAD